ncbi:PAS domain-containing protein [Thalassobaculum sp. OXR-137]|uniref:PAS domain-containing protein n=1 Tax=Thalassobaculum sp. OXR-137 TaxID=3100173 RepID=UPI002AC8BF3D|nr:PAS domain-containing protein [Thalassobaculum sp. OXR-137]WPZ34288.1 PAS domain-containing protein [Thalassobaculum sp. OXR-137]
MPPLTLAPDHGSLMSQPLSDLVGRFRQERLQVLEPESAVGKLADHPKALTLFRAWQKWCRGRICPERADVEPLDIPALLEYIVLLDVEERDFRFRLVGETIANRYAIRLKGKTITQLMAGSSLDETLYEHRRCAQDRRPVLVTHTDAMTSLGDTRSYSRLLLPLGAQGPRASHIIGVMQFYR